MKIHINSRRIDGYKLIIYADGLLAFEGNMQSDPKGCIDLNLCEISTLKFEYRYLTKKERKTISDKCVKSNNEKVDYIAYDWGVMNSCAPIEDIHCPKPGESLYSTVISNIPNDCKEIKLLFRSSALNEDMPVLAVMNRNLRDIVEVRYERNENYIDIIKNAKRRVYKFYFIIDFIVLLVLLYWLYAWETSDSILKGLRITPVAMLCGWQIKRIYDKNKTYKKFFRRVEEIRVFKHINGKLSIIE